MFFFNSFDGINIFGGNNQTEEIEEK